MIRIVHVISSLNRGGRERQLSTIVFNTDQDLYRSKIVFFNKSESDYFEEYKLTEKSIRIVSRSFISRLSEISRILKEESPDLIYTWGNIESVFVILLYPFHRFKFINGSVRHGIRSPRFSHYFRTLILHLSRNVVANSWAGLRANNLRRGIVLRNGIDKKFIGMLSPEEKTTRRRALLNGCYNKILLISVANLVPYKDYFSILSALSSLEKIGYDFHYLILGEGPLRVQIEKRINDYNLSDNVELFGNIPNVQDYLKIADIFIHSSKGEGCSNAILEAMAAGLPIIASDTGGTSEIVCMNNGFLFKYQDSKQIANLIMQCLEDKELRQTLGANSLLSVSSKFTIDSMMNNYYDLINQVMKG